MTVNKLKILLWDIETAPGLAYYWRAKTTFINHGMVKSWPWLLGWSAKWADRNQIISDMVTPEEAVARDDTRVAQSIADLIREADILVAHNGDDFDLPFLTGRLWVNQLEPIGPVDTIDTKKLASKDLGLTHNNLDAIARMRGQQEKLKTDFSLWLRCMEGEQKALNEMKKYNRNDVEILHREFEDMKPYVTRLKRLVDTTKSLVCLWCGSDQLQSRGERKMKRTPAYTYLRFYCTNCKRYPSYKTRSSLHVSDMRI